MKSHFLKSMQIQCKINRSTAVSLLKCVVLKPCTVSLQSIQEVHELAFVYRCMQHCCLIMLYTVSGVKKIYTCNCNTLKTGLNFAGATNDSGKTDIMCQASTIFFSKGSPMATRHCKSIAQSCPTF